MKNKVIKKVEYNKLVYKADKIDTTGFVLKDTYDTDKSNPEQKISDVDKKIPDVSSLVRKTNFIDKVTEIQGKIPSISGLATDLALTAAENKIPDVSSLVTKADFDAKLKKISDIVT